MEKNQEKTTPLPNKSKILSIFALEAKYAAISLETDRDGHRLRIPKMRVDTDKSKVRTVWQQDTERDILLVGYDLMAVEALESSGMDASTLTPVTVTLPLDTYNGALRSLVKNGELENVEFIGFKALPTLKRSGDYASLSISFTAENIKEI